jgi:hypothetical protein
MARELVVLGFLTAVAMCVFNIMGRMMTPVRDKREMQTGDQLRLKDDIPLRGKHLIIAVSDDCSYCRRSVAFYQRLVAEAHRLGISVVATSDRKMRLPVELRGALGPLDRTVSGDFGALGIIGTPTVVLVEDETVKSVWRGLLSPQLEDALLARIDGSFYVLTNGYELDKTLLGERHTYETRRLAKASFEEETEKFHLVDARVRKAFARSHLGGAINIPYDEIAFRAAIELTDAEKPVLVDCTELPSAICGMTASILVRQGRPGEVWLLNYGAMGASCFVTPLE